MGGFGSGLAYTGVGNTFLAVPDRGPADGTVNYFNRYYTLDIPLTPETVTPVLKATNLLKTPRGQNLTGLSSAFDLAKPEDSLRFDPEGIRVAFNRKIFISDEYGPYIYEFDGNGTRTRAFKIPDKFFIAHPSADPTLELGGNDSGRQANRGMEGLAITPDGSKLFGIMQNALIQDQALTADLKRRGRYNRILELDLRTGATREYAYKIEDKSYGVNEILAVNDRQFLVIERDGKDGEEASFKKIFRIDLEGASDVSHLEGLPEKGDPVGFTPVTKSLFIDLLDPAFGLGGANFPEKIEGLAFGPDLPDGRHSLLVTSDNDFVGTQASQIWVFAFGEDDLPGFQPQTFQYTYQDISSEVKVRVTPFPFSRLKQHGWGLLTITNRGRSTIPGPITVALSDLTPGVTLVNANGSYNGIPAIVNVASSGLHPGESVTVPLHFSNPSWKWVVFKTLTLTTTPSTSTRFAVFSDPHFYDGQKLGTSSPEFQAYLAQDRKLIAESSEILTTVIKELQAKTLDFVLVAGDLTKDGEEVNHQVLASRLAELEAGGKKVYVVPGNHDINNPHALSYLTSPPRTVANVSPREFKRIYAEFGYGEALSVDPHSLSYIAEPVPGVWLFALDSCRYAGGGVTEGGFSDATQRWVLNRLTAARKLGKKVIGLMHHGLLEHFTGQSILFPEYVIENWQKVSRLFSDKGLNLVFTGHFHSNDITSADFTSSSLTDVETGSLVTFPCPYRTIDFDVADARLAVETEFVKAIPSHPDDFPAFAEQYLKSGLEGITRYQLSQPPYSLTEPALSYVAPLVVSAMMAHYAGDENPDPGTQAVIDAFMADPDPITQALGQSLNFFWNDLRPADNAVNFGIASSWE
jgi:hypothetical protein